MPTRPDAYVDIGAAGAPTFSYDGKTLFHLRGAGVPQLWALDLATGDERQLSFHDEKIAFLRRAPNDDRLIYGMDRGGDERQQLWLLDPGKPQSEPRALTANPAAIHEFGSWAQDGARFAYAANDHDEANFDVYVQQVETGARERVFRGRNIVSAAGFHPDGTRLILIEDRGYADMSLRILDLATGEAPEFRSPEPCNYQSVRWAGDGRSLLALTEYGGSDFLRLCRLDPISNAVDVVYAAPGRDVEAWALAPDTGLLATVENDNGYAVLRVGPLDGERPIVGNLPRGIVTEPAFSRDGISLAFTVAAPTEPPALYLWRDGTARAIWRPDPVAEAGADRSHFATFEPVAWPSFDGMSIPGWLALPHGPPPAGGHPAIVWVHGGPAAQTKANFRPDIQMLVAQGFAVLLPNVRGSTGYGRAYTESDDVEKRLHSVADLAHGRHWLAAHPAIDGDRIGIMGQSYGGFMVLSAITEYPDLWRAAVDFYGIADFVTLLARTGSWRSNHRATEYGHPDRDAELFARISPIHRVDRVQAPLLVLHGTRDPRVPIGESEQFVAALQERQKKVTYLTFDYAGHGFIRTDDRRRVYREVADFFTAHLR
jgi:dipeptidyl aminopeptidase/acylaminoacyl peptidase